MPLHGGLRDHPLFGFLAQLGLLRHPALLGHPMPSKRGEIAAELISTYIWRGGSGIGGTVNLLRVRKKSGEAADWLAVILLLEARGCPPRISGVSPDFGPTRKDPCSTVNRVAQAVK